MAKLTTIAYDDEGRPIITQTELPPRPERSVSKSSAAEISHQPRPQPKSRVPSSPHKPYISPNFYIDLTSSPSSIAVEDDIAKQQAELQTHEVLKEMNTSNITTPHSTESSKPVIDLTETPPVNKSVSENLPPSGFRKASHFIDPSAILPANSSLWKSSKVDVRKPSPTTNSASSSTSPSSQQWDRNSPEIIAGSSTKPTPIPFPSQTYRPPPVIPESKYTQSKTAFIHPESIYSTPMRKDDKQTEEELKNFFEGALEADGIDETTPKDEEDEEAGYIDGLKVTLMAHQISGLEFLQNHESTEENKKGKGKYGGILADDMGLGKTIQTLALIITRPRPFEKKEPSTFRKSKATLLVVPLALVDQWRREIREKTNLSVNVHHGPKRETLPARIANYDVVVTTYDTVSSEWFGASADSTDKGKCLFRVNWWRIVLDEAHTIKNRLAKMSQACCDLNAQYRWCLTGTPYQNNVDDVYSLIKFLRIPPFDDRDYWKVRISNLAKGDRMSLALQRLRTLLRAIMLRRTKAILKNGGIILPEKEIISEELEFDAVERKFYENLRMNGQQAIEELANSAKGLKGNMMCLLTMLLRMRQATDHIDLLKDKVEDVKDEIKDTIKPDEKGDADELTDLMSGLAIETRCGMCFITYSSSSTGNNSRIRSGRDYCENCETNMERYQVKRSETGSKPSSKIRRMLEILKTNVDDEPVKTIIFSQFTCMLDVVEPYLRQHNIQYGRYDGKMRKDQRDATLQAFRTTSMPVLLVSLKAGSVGLNLTAASRVIMVDMWWNPAIEEQAIDRVHRIGQTKRVVVHKLMIRNSVDEKILELQKQKKEAANGALGDGVIRRKGKIAPNKLSMDEILYLFGANEEYEE